MSRRPMEKEPKSNRLAFLDVIRGVAALAVAVQHALEHAYPAYTAWSLRYLNLGAFGVVAFFLVSGFIIPYSLERGGSLGRFWVGRVFRLYPLYWASLLAALLLGRLGLDPLPAEATSRPLRFALANATMAQEAFRVPHAIGVYWTLGVEMSFYLAVSALFALGLHRRSRLWAWLATLGMLGLTLLAALLLHRSLPAGRLGLVVSAFVGTLLFRVYSGAAERRWLYPLLAAVAGTFLLGFYLRYQVYPGPERSIEWTFPAVASSWTLGYLFVLAAYRLREARFPGPLLWLGRVSYSVYLVHALVLEALPGKSLGLLWVASALALTLAVSALSYALVEQPSVELGKRASERLSPAPASPAGA